MDKSTKKGLVEFFIAFAIFIALAIVAAFFDLAINKALYNPESLYGQYFAKLGELPTYLTAPIVGIVIFHVDLNRGKKISIAQKVIGAIVAFAGFFVASIWFFKNFIRTDLDYKYLYQVVFSAILALCAILGTGRIEKKAMQKFLIFALFLLVVMAISNIIVQVMKILWARQRFRTMTPENPLNEALIAEFGADFKGFAPWYKPEFIFKSAIRTESYVNAFKEVDSDTFKSFPSGHTVAASASFALIILPEMYEKLKNKRWLFWVIPIAYTTIVAVSRIVMGAHYLSDVLFGGFIGLGVAALARLVFVKKGISAKDSLFVKTEDTVLE